MCTEWYIVYYIIIDVDREKHPSHHPDGMLRSFEYLKKGKTTLDYLMDIEQVYVPRKRLHFTYCNYYYYYAVEYIAT